MKADAEWSKLGQVPGLIDGWTDVKDMVNMATEDFNSGHSCSSCAASAAAESMSKGHVPNLNVRRFKR